MQMGNLICTVLAVPSISAPAHLKVLTGEIVLINTPNKDIEISNILILQNIMSQALSKLISSN